jgi:LuxR family transcriptional regulator, maltose regulon positive regulatory protein
VGGASDVDEMTQRDGSLPSSAKFVRPAPPSDVPRRRVVRDRLAAAVGRVVVIAAPAGYGKTTQLATWVAEDNRAVSWVTLEPVDNDGVLLLRTLVEVLAQVSDLDARELLDVENLPSPLSVLVVPVLRRAVASCQVPFVLVLDDAHLVEDPLAVDLLEAVASAVPQGSTVVIAGRAAPRSSLGRLRVQPGVVEIGPADLALDTADAAALLHGLGLDLDGDALTNVMRATEGWPVGVRLAGLAMLGDAEPPAARMTLDGADHVVADYLRTEWMSGLSVDDAHFLMRAACLDWLSGPLCDEVLGRTGSGTQLERLHRSRMLVIPLDRRHDAYRIHALLSDFLQAELRRQDPAAVRQLHARASSWFERHGEVDLAVTHAFRAEDPLHAEDLVLRYGGFFLTMGRHITVHRWLSMFAPDVCASRPGLAVMNSTTALVMGDGAAFERWLRFAEQALAVPGDHEQVPHQVAILRACLGTDPYPGLLADLEGACHDLPLGVWRVFACLAAGALLLGQGSIDRAVALIAEGAAEARICEARGLEANCCAFLALACSRTGDWEAADASARLALRIVDENDTGEPAPTMVMVWAFNALLSARAGDSAAARARARKAREQLASFDAMLPWVTVPARIALSRVCLLLGDRAGAQVLLAEAQKTQLVQPDAVSHGIELNELTETIRTAKNVLPARPSSLTTAELRVLHYLPTNLTLADIASRLFVSRNTVKSQAVAIYRKLNATSRGEAVEIAREAGLLPEGLAARGGLPSRAGPLTRR